MTDTAPADSPLISYAQNFEDVILWRALKEVEGGFYIDVGAQDPLEDSVSLGFYEKGWRGVHVEPTLHYAEKLRAARPDETVIQAAVAARPGLLHFYEVVETGLSTGDPAQAARHREAGFTVRETDVPAIPLGALLDRFAERPIHWLKIDVEGFEQQVLESWGGSTVRPWIVVVESVLPGTQTPSHGGWDGLLGEKGYAFVHFDGLNRYYLAEAHRALAEHLRAGPNVFDEFVLSGTSTNRFCRLLLNRAAGLQAMIDRQAATIAHQTESHAELTARQAQYHADLMAQREEIHAGLIARQEQIQAAARAEAQFRLDTALEERDHARFEAGQFRQSLDELHAAHRQVVRDAQSRIARLGEETGRHQAEKARLEAETARLETEMARLEAETAQETARLHDALQRQAAHAAAELHAVNVRLANTINSTSWKLTRPWRLAGRIVKRLIRALSAAPHRLSALSRRLPGALIAAVRARPALKRAVVRLLDRFPGLAARARRYAHRRPGTPPITASPIVRPAEDGLPLLSASARRIRARLARSHPRGGNLP